MKKNKNPSKKNPLKVALFCGGPSGERGISLNSARSLCDHLDAPDIKLIPIYIDLSRKYYRISRAQLYCNTPSDFDFKLKQTASPISKQELVKLLKKVDLAMPIIHGEMGEDGELQALFEKLGCPYIGPTSSACKAAFDKALAHDLLVKNDFFTIDTVLLEAGKIKAAEKKINDFFSVMRDQERAIIKPAIGGSSLGVYAAKNKKEAVQSYHSLVKQSYKRIVMQPFCKGTEFTVIVLENRFGQPVSLPVIEIETDYSEGQIFDYRKKYLATNQTAYHCPAKFSESAHSKIQTQAEQIFAMFKMKGFARLDGWLLPDGNVWFFDFNPISGMEQNSFLFIAASRIGMSHADLCRYLVKIECDRVGISLAAAPPSIKHNRKSVSVLFGGDTAERQVSLMSGTNVWLKLRGSNKFEPTPFLLDINHNVWRLPYAFTLNHTVEEITERCKSASKVEDLRARYAASAILKLSPLAGQLSLNDQAPEKITIDEFVKQSDFIFNTVHGGIGEDGTLQAAFLKHKVPFNGSDSDASKICMDKYRTGQIVTGLNNPSIRTAKKLLIALKDIANDLNKNHNTLDGVWKELKDTLLSDTVIVKPQSDGCSAGIVRLYNAKDLSEYCRAAISGAAQIPSCTLTAQANIVEMPTTKQTHLMFEEFIETDIVRVIGNKLSWKSVTGWIEVTVGVLGKKKKMNALSPSITVASGDILSLEEKFQGGTGVNITPPPTSHVSLGAVKKVKKHIAEVANALGIGGYSRIDAFMHIKTGDVVIIEANTLPGLTGSTVLFHQGLAEKPALYPRDLLEKIVQLGY